VVCPNKFPSLLLFSTTQKLIRNHLVEKRNATGALKNKIGFCSPREPSQPHGTHPSVSPFCVQFKCTFLD